MKLKQSILRPFNKDAPEIIAAVDLGSNSFHLKLTQAQDGELKVLDRIREMVRLAGGLDNSGRLDNDTTRRALDCLQRFGQRLRHIPSRNIRVVGTNTLRKIGDNNEFFAQAESAIGHNIEVISGLEEARLIYLGVSHSIASSGDRRLVIDIGGSSTELIIGEQFDPIYMESLQLGCVSLSKTYFSDGALSRKRLQKAELAARLQFEPFESRFRALGWKTVIGASGTIRAVSRVAYENGWSNDGITLSALTRLVDILKKTDHVDNLNLAGLAPERAPVFPGGVMVLLALFEALGIEHMLISDGALREGLLYDLLGRIRHEDIRSRTSENLAARYRVDREHSARIQSTAIRCLSKVAKAWAVDDELSLQLLQWASQLHEIGLDIAHSQYHKHGGYILENADLPGFSQQEQQWLALLIRSHRGKFPCGLFKQLAKPWSTKLLRLAVLLRLAIVLHRSRSPNPLVDFDLNAGKRSLVLSFPEGWLEQRPLTCADLEQESGYLSAAGFQLGFS